MFKFGPARGSSEAEARALQLIGAHPVLMFSKTYCPYCVRAKAAIGAALDHPALARPGVPPVLKVIELDTDSKGSELQDALAALTGQRSVPNVFVGGAHVGGCDDTLAAAAACRLPHMLAGSTAALAATVAAPGGMGVGAGAAAPATAPSGGPVEFQLHGGELKTYDCHVSSGG